MIVDLRAQAVPGATAWWPDDSGHRIDRVIENPNDYSVSFADLPAGHSGQPLYWLYARNGMPIDLPEAMRIVRIDPPPPTAAELLARIGQLEAENRDLRAMLARSGVYWTTHAV